MPSPAIQGFVKKRTATQRYKRSPRQIARDVTVALEMRDESVLPHLRIRTEDGETIDGGALTVDAIKQLKNDGQNPKWYFRTSWLEESYGRRDGKEPVTKSEPMQAEDAFEVDSPPTDSASTNSLLEMMKESIRELKQDKQLLVDQIKIKDEQIKETTERWKESNYIAQGLNQRLEAMEKRLELTTGKSTENDVDLARPTAAEDSSPAPPLPKSKKKKTTRRAKQNAASAHKKKSSQTKNPASLPRGKKTKRPKWYETPTISRFLSR